RGAPHSWERFPPIVACRGGLHNTPARSIVRPLPIRTEKSPGRYSEKRGRRKNFCFLSDSKKGIPPRERAAYNGYNLFADAGCACTDGQNRVEYHCISRSMPGRAGLNKDRGATKMGKFNFIQTEIPGVVIIEPTV